VPVRVRFAPSPTGSLHVGSALTAVANREFADARGGVLLLRIDDTDPARVVPGAEAAILEDLRWLGIGWDEGPVHQSGRADFYAEAAARLEESGAARREDDRSLRFEAEGRPTLVRADGTATYHLASVVDDAGLAVTHVIRGKDLLPSAALHQAIARALGAEPPEFIHHGLLVGEDGTKLSKRHGAVSLAELRMRGLPPEAVRRYLAELGLPRGDVHFDETRLARLAVEALAALSNEELAARVDAPVAYAPALRGAHDLAEARAFADLITEPPRPAATESPETLARFRALREAAPDELDPDAAHALVAKLREDGGNLRALRLALTGAERGPELWALVVALPRREAIRRTTPP
jgi:glutamyl-tRNA synthetase